MSLELKAPIMGLDVGEVRIGIALSDALHLTAQAHSVLQRKNPAQDLKAIEELVAERGVKRIVVGLPRNLAGRKTQSTKRSEEFAEQLRRTLSGVEVELWDERLTTVQAESMLIEAGTRRKNRKKVVDKIAAVLLLQNYLDAGQA